MMTSVKTLFCAAGLVTQMAAQNLVVDVSPSHAANSFSPVRALGAAVDRLGLGVADKELTGPMLQVILDSGWQSITYRQNTELHAEAWHWNPQGARSDPAGRGYFTGNATPTESIRHSFGYALPHRGTTRAARAGTSYYSRLTDGDTNSYWKSNPYLTSAYTGEDDSLHPQWVIVDLGSLQPVNAIRIAWAEPFAKTYFVQFWTGGEQNPRRATTGLWQTFPAGSVNDGHGGTVSLALTRFQVPARYIRIWMTASSNTCDTHGSGDRRNCVGFAIGEVSVGTLAKNGEFQDLVKHVAGTGQTSTICSSVDPWHEASGINEKAGEQVGFDFFFETGVTRGLPVMVPVAMLYATPEDAAAEIAYLEKRRYPISYVELGEEPDGQRMLPEDYAALYVQWAAAIHKVNPKLKLGGPVFEGVNEDIKVWPDAAGRVSWFGRFLDYLKAHGRLLDLAFMSFEHYPYTPCQSKWEDLYREPELIAHIMDVWKDDGLPPNVPMLMTEGNVSSRGGITAVDMMGGLWLADYVGAFLSAGGAATYYFHYVSNPLGAGCGDNGGGALTFLNMDRDYKMRGHLSQYFASQVITREWVQPVDADHRVFRVSSDVRDKTGNVLVTAYAVLRPDGQWSLLIVNKDHDSEQRVRIAFHDADSHDSFTGSEQFFSGPLSVVNYGAAQFQWHSAGADSYADPDAPPVKSSISADAETSYTLPKASITVIRGRIRAR
jgi:hypothetical protein